MNSLILNKLYQFTGWFPKVIYEYSLRSLPNCLITQLHSLELNALYKMFPATHLSLFQRLTVDLYI